LSVLLGRRRFLAGLAAGVALAPLARAASSSDVWESGFAAARATDPSLMAFDSAPLAGYAAEALTVEGTWPSDLRGALFRNGPARNSVFGQRYHHFFDGDGLVHRYDVGPEGVTHRGAYVETAKFTAENAAGRALESGFGTYIAPPAGPDSMNVANTSVLLDHGRLLALWEGGSAYALNPGDLSTKGPVHWSPETAGLPFSAHPVRDRDGSLWNIGVVGYAGKMVVYRIGADGSLAQARLVPMPIRSMVHAFLVTERHLVIPLPPFVHEPDLRAPGRSFFETHAWRPELGTQVLILPKDDLGAPRLVEMPAGFVFHYGNGWESPDGAIRFDACWYDDASVVTTGLRDVMRGQRDRTAPSRAAIIEIAPGARQATPIVTSIKGEFPVVDPRLVTRRNRFVYSVGAPTGEQGIADMRQIVRHDVEQGGVAAFDYGDGVTAEEHLFVPRRGSAGEAEGWLLGSSLDYRHGRSRLAVFDAARLADGPLAIASLPYAMPLGLHGCFASDDSVRGFRNPG
jgi:carotenoid cleavage dioxygenase